MSLRVYIGDAFHAGGALYKSVLAHPDTRADEVRHAFDLLAMSPAQVIRRVLLRFAHVDVPAHQLQLRYIRAREGKRSSLDFLRRLSWARDEFTLNCDDHPVQIAERFAGEVRRLVFCGAVSHLTPRQIPAVPHQEVETRDRKAE